MKFIRTLFLLTALSMSLMAREQVNVNFSNLSVNDFIKLISKISHKNILINNRINGTVNFVSTTPIYNDELMGILIAVLESKGYTLVQDGSIYEVVRATDAAKHNVKVLSSNKKPSGSLMVTQAIKVHNANVDVVAAKIRYLISRTARLMTMRENNTILITDYPKNIETIKTVIHDLELHKERVIKIIDLKHTEAKKLQSRINEIARSIFNNRVVSENVKVLLDTNINGLILIGNKKNVAILDKLIKKLDVESSVKKSVEIFDLKNSDAKNVLKSLNAIVSKQVFSDPSLKPSLSANEAINAIIVVGVPRIVKGLKLIIDELDKEKYQVYVQARIIEINKDNAENLGVRYGFDGAALSAAGLYSLAANFGGAPVEGVVGNALANSIVGSAATSGFALGAAVDFLETNGASKSVSNPSILCVNNKQSSIYVGKTISVSTGTVSTASGVNNAATTYKREDVGLTLTIKPRVSSNDKVTLDVSVVLENLLSKDSTGQPVTSKQEVKTEAILRDGESIIIGGLVKNYERNSLSKVPFLGDIPLIGSWLFSSKSKTQEQDNLVVILTPYVIDKSEELSKLQKDLGLLAKMQRSYDKKVFKELKEKKLEAKSDAQP